MLSNKLRRTLSFLLALTMTASLLPAPVWATEAEHSHEEETLAVTETEPIVTEQTETLPAETTEPAVTETTPATTEAVSIETETVTTEPADTVPQETESSAAAETTVPETVPEDPMISYQEQANAILVDYLGTTQASWDEIQAAVSPMDFDTYQTARWQIHVLLAEINSAKDCGTVSEEQVQQFEEENEPFFNFFFALEEKDANDENSPSLLADVTKNFTLTVTGGNLGVNATWGSYNYGFKSGEYGSISPSANATSSTLTIKSNSKKTTTVILTNNTGETKQLYFEYTTTNGSLSFSPEDSTSAGSPFSLILENTKSLTISFKSSSYASEGGTATLSNIALNTVAEGYDITVTANGSGTVTADGQAIANNVVSSVSPTTGTVLAATPSSGYTFLGWIDSATGSILSESASYTVKPTSDMSVQAVFASTSPWFKVDGLYLVETISAAAAKGSTMVLMNNATLPAGNYTIPAGVTLVIPYSDSASSNTNPLTDPDRIPEATTYVAPSVFRTLTVPSGATISCAGNIRVDGRQYSASTQYTGHVFGAYGKIALEGTINLTGTATLRAYGYITGGGSVNAASGTSVYELFQVADWRGGNNTSKLYEGMKGDSFLISCFYIQNVESKLVLHSGSSLITHVTIAAGWIGDKTPYNSTAKLVASDGLFQLGSGAKLTRSYSGGRMTYKVDGNSTFGSISLKLSTGLGSFNMNSNEYLLNLPSHMTIQFVSGTAEIPVKVKLLPGTILQIDSGATVNMSSGSELVIYDNDDWKSGNYTYTSTFNAVKYSIGTKMGSLPSTPGQLIVNGTLNVGNGAAVYSTNQTGSTGNNGLSGSGAITIGTAPTTVRSTITEIKGSSTEKGTIAVTALQALLKGISTSASDYAHSMAYGKTYFGRSDKYWYNFVVNADSEQSKGKISNITDLAAETEKTSVKPYGQNEIPNVLGYVTFSNEKQSVFGFQIDDQNTTVTVTNAELDGTYSLINVADHATVTLSSSHTHTAGDTVVENEKAATCTAEGSYEAVVYCSECGEEMSRNTVTVEKAAHSPAAAVEEKRVESTCTVAGSYDSVVYCSACNAELSRETKALELAAHTEGEAVVENKVAATCTAEGSYDNVVYCTICNTELSRDTVTVDKIAHTVVIDEAVAPTCTETGLTEGSHCSVCGEVLVAQEVVDALGHDWTDADCDTPKTCSVCGETEGEALGHTWSDATCTVAKTCSVCGETEGEALGHTWTDADCDTPKTCSVCGATEGEALGHSYETVVTAPTCADKGYTTYTCSVCGDTYKADEVDALGHSWVDADCDTPKTCSVCGETEGEALGHSWADADCDTPKTCSVCGETEGEALGHTWSDATCTEAKTCSVCGKTEGEALGHEYEAVVTAPTCTEAGYTTYTCSACGDSYKADEVDALGHSWVDADCDTPKTCSVCGETDGEAVGHSYEAVVTAPTCTEAGYTTYTCSACGDSYVGDETEAAGHSYTPVVTAPTCTEDGYTTYTCSVCGDSYTADEVDALGHTWTEADCDTPKTCSVCGETEGEALGHEYEAVVTVPTCTEAGYTTYTCSACGDSYKADEVAALGHDWTDANCDTPKTCSVCGVTEGEALGHTWSDATCTEAKTCSVCGKTEGEALGHEYEAVVTVPTCTEAGYTTYTCSACGDSYKADEVAALGHSWVDADCDTPKTCSVCGETDGEAVGHSYEAVVTAPTCTEAGYTTYTCSACGDSYVGDETEAAGHSYTPVVTAPTCTDAGYTTYTCSVCGDSYKADEVDALGHTEAEAVIENNVAPDCTTDGSYDNVTYCTVCGVETSRETITVDALGHTAETVSGKAATCTETGLTDGTRCSVCGETLTAQEEIPALGHDEVVDAAVAATCTETGLTEGSHCSTCGEVLVNQEEVAALGHTEVEIPAVEATFEAPGATAGVKCSVCNEVLTAPVVIPQKVAVAQVSDTKYETLAAAIEAAGENGAVTLLANVAEEVTVNKAVIITKNGFTAVIVAGDGFEVAETDEAYVVSVKVEKELIPFAGTTMTLGNSLAMNFVINTSLMEGTNNYAVITKEYADGREDVVVSIPQSEWKVYSGKLYYFSFNEIAAKEMTDNLFAVVYDNSGEPISVTKKDSVRDYAMRGIMSEESKNKDAEKLALYVDMLNYGAAAQDYFDDYHINDLANSQLTATQQAYATGDVVVEDERVKGTGYAGSTLTLREIIQLNFVFNKSTVTQDMYAIATYFDHYGRAKSIRIEGQEFVQYDSKRWYIPVTSLSVADCRQLVTVNVYNADGSDVTSASDSVSSYVARGAGEILYTMVMKFSTSAYATFH